MQRCGAGPCGRTCDNPAPGPSTAPMSKTVLLLALLSSWPLVADPGPAPAAAAPVRMLGELALARGTLGFAPCMGEAAPARAVGAAREAATQVAALNRGADGSVFVDVDAMRDADGAWRIERVRRAYRRGPRCSEDLGEFVWRGTLADGRWTFNVSRRYVVVRPPDARAAFFRYQPFVATADGALRFAAQADGRMIEATLRAQRCRVVGGEAVSDWSVQVVLDGATHLGCAWAGEPR